MDNRWTILCCEHTENAGTHRGSHSREWKERQDAWVWRGGKSPRGKAGADGSEIKVAKMAEAVPRKAAMAVHAPVPQTDTGRKGEEPKAGGRSIVKELGKMTP